jgi:prevent-host-death family protein
MREIQAANAKTHLPQLLDAVERGETIIITRHGRPVARLIPDTGNRAALTAQAIDRIKALRSRKERITVDELLSARHEGRRS